MGNPATQFLFSSAHRALPSACSALALSTVLLTPLLLTSMSATAQSSSETQVRTLEEVIVTARRRDESLSNVPLAITALGTEQLMERQVATDSDLQAAVPGLTIRQTQGNNSLTYSIRGQTADTFSGSPSAVITYFNEVPLTVGSSSSLFDLESVQVLKGPQGTLFGRNATGGAVLFSSAKPTNDFGAALTVRAGNYNLREVEGMINLPLIDDTLLLRVAVNSNEKDGYIDNLINGDRMGDIERNSGRVSLTWRPSDRLENTSVLQYSDIDGTNTGASYTYSVYSCGETNNGVALSCGSGLMFGPGLDSVYGSGAWDAFVAANPHAYAPGLIAYLQEQERIGPYKTRHPGGAKHSGSDLMFTNTTTFDINDNLRLKNILGVSRSRVDSEQPQLGAPFVTILTANVNSGESGNEQDVDSISEELQLQGTAGDLTYILGAYYQRSRINTLWPQTYFDLRPVAAPDAVTNAFRLTNETKAVFAQGTYDLSSLTSVEGLSVTAGVRYTWEDVELSQRSEATYTSGAASQSESFSDPGWELGLEYQATDSLLTYLKTRGSFRSGGFNGAAQPVNADATGGGNKFDSEHVKDVEAGLKFSGLLLERPTTLNLAVYKQWIEDVQRVEFPDPDGPGGLASIAVTANVPEMVVKGIELEASIMATDWLELGLSGAYTDAEFTDGDVNLFGTMYSYGPVGDTPEHSGRVYASLDLPLADGMGQMRLYGEVYAQSKQYFSNAASSVGPRTELPSYELVNARLSWTGIMGSPFSAALFGKNLTDEEYFVGGMTLAPALGHNAAAVGEPRTYGVEFSYRY